MWYFVWRLPPEKYQPLAFYLQAGLNKGCFQSRALQPCQYRHESQSCWHPGCKSFRRKLSTEKPVGRDLLEYVGAFWKPHWWGRHVQGLGIASDTWKPNHHLRYIANLDYSSQHGYMLHCRWSCAMTTKTLSCNVVWATHGGVTLSAVSHPGQRLLCEYNQPSMSKNYIDEHCFD